MKLSFYGAAQEVTGSNYLLESGGEKILIDCGLHQGGSFCEEHNFEPFGFNPKEIKAVVVTHAHIDHIGRLPQLVDQGFTGTIFSTPPTRDEAELLLLDSEHILNQEAERHGKPMIYGVEDVVQARKQWQIHPYHQPFSIGPFKVEFFDAGHVLGSAFVKIEAEGKSVIFSGDLGNNPAPFINPTEDPSGGTVAIIESTYGGRIHKQGDIRRQALKTLITETVNRGGTVMIPAFALERIQEIIFELNNLIESGELPRVPVFVDSPLAIRLTAVYQKYSSEKDYFNKAATERMRGGDAIFDFPGLRLTLTTQQSKEINSVTGPKVIIAGAGMSQGGRIMHHELRYLSDPNSAILFVGYQARGSLGRRLIDGEPMVRIMGEHVPVRCTVKAIGGYSAHADQPQLVKWLRDMEQKPQKVFITHGEVEEAQALADKVKTELNLDCHIPERGESVVI
jgi:metallo-beta-lactamase family protein